MKWKITTLVFVSIAAILSGVLLAFWQNRLDLAQTNNKKVQEFYSQLANSQVSFTDAGKLVFPDEQKFLDAKSRYLAAREKFVEVDLKAMKLRLYENGSVVQELAVLTKGREGSWWETATGDYAVLGKEANHFSSIGKVWMPYSIQFYGNFFIHGWPYYDNGQPVQKIYSGGCIRLATDDAKIVYEFVSKDTPILVFDKEAVLSYGFLRARQSGLLPVPPTTAAGLLVVNLATGQTLLEKNIDEELPIASLTKLMTGVVASELIYLDRLVTVAKPPLAAALQVFKPQGGERYSAFDLLYPLLMQSSNDAAASLAGFIGEPLFVRDMNKKAESLGMLHTQFADPSGISADNRSTAKDLVRLLQYIYYKRSFLFDITKGKDYGTFGPRKLDELKNFNEFYEAEDLIGVKNGETRAAKQTMITVWNIRTLEGSVPVAIIVLGSDGRVVDTQALLGWLKNSFAVL